MGEAAAAHRWRRRYYFADPAEVARRVYFPRPGCFCLLFYRGRKQNNRPEGTRAAGYARAAAAAGRPCSRPAGGRRGLLRPARAVPAALRTVSWEARQRAAHLLACSLPVSPAAEAGLLSSLPAAALSAPRRSRSDAASLARPPEPRGRRRAPSASLALPGWPSQPSAGRAPGVQNKCWCW